jgi:competence protein ComGC
VDQPEGWLIMPTDLGVVSERKRKAAQAQAQTEVTILLVFVIISLVMLVLLVADQSFSKATIELMGHLAP